MADEPAQTPTDSDDGGGGAPADAPPVDGGGEEAGGLDLEVERGRLDEVENKIEEGRRALADAEDDAHPEADGPPIAAGEGAANAPPG